jgi:hypothetical protein
MTYLELVNNVLIRLREDEVSSVNENAYSKMVGRFVVDAQRQVEDAYNWNSLSNTLTMNTVPDLFNGVLVGSGVRFRLIDVIDDTNNKELTYRSSKEMNDLFLNRDRTSGPPLYYNFNGVNSEGDTQVDLFPIPDAVYTIRFNIIQPQDPLKFDADQLLVPSEPVIFLAYAKAIAERGEDAGLGSSEAYALFKESLADHISIESGRYLEESIWTVT